MPEPARLKAVTLGFKLVGLKDTPEEVERGLEIVEMASAVYGNARVYAWARRVAQKRVFRCANQRVKARRDGTGRMVMWINCQQRSCDYCSGLRAGQETERLVKLFKALDRPVYVVHTTQAKASSIVDYATRLDAAAVAIPQPNGQAVVFTTHQRKDAVELFDMGVYLDSLADEVYRAYAAVPAYSTSAGDQQHRVRMNRVLRQISEKSPETAPVTSVEPRECEPSGEWYVLPEAALLYAVKHQFPIGFDTRRRVVTIDLSDVDPGLVTAFERLEGSGQDRNIIRHN